MMHALTSTKKLTKIYGRRARVRALGPASRVMRHLQAPETPRTPAWRGASKGIESLHSLMLTAQSLCARLQTTLQPTMLRVVAVDHGDLVIFDARQIGRFFAAGKYSGFSADGREYLTNESLRSLEARLAQGPFMRVHRSELVNLEHVCRLRRVADAGVLVLQDGQEVHISRQLLPMVREQLLAPRCS